MAFAGVNYVAVALAGVAGWLVGALWYWVLSKPWMAANAMTPETIKAHGGSSPLPFIIAFVANLIMAWAIAGLLGHFGQFTIKDGIISGAACWLGFVITTMTVNNVFAKRNPVLLLIDGGHWLAVLMVQGAVIGAMGV
ncbi:MAG: DUF1761 domain-containing protein [Alphaproteobacteria bacterium]